MQDFVVLECYNPWILYPDSWIKCWRIGRDLTRLTRSKGLVPFDVPDTRFHKAPWSNAALHAHVRKRTLRSGEGAQWHQDGDFGHVPMDHGLVFWSNTHPTELRLLDGTIVPTRPYDVIYIRNISLFHRRPPNAPRERYFFRQRVQ